MKQVILSPRTGAVEVADVPVPQVRPGAVLVRNAASVVSTGTERQVIDLAGKSLLGKARARPDLVREVINKVRRDGLRTTVRESLLRLEIPQPLGYSSAGTVLDVGAGVPNIRPGDRVACAGAGWAAHAEVVVAPHQLCATLPSNVSWEAAAFGMLGAIALNGIRRAGSGLGENVAVLGLGMVGQLTVQLLRSAGCRVLAHDVASSRTVMAEQLGADIAVADAEEMRAAARRLSGGIGMDAVIVTASTSSDLPLELAADIARVRGTIVMVGVTGMHVPRRPFWQKELALLMSRASGPGSEEKAYENRGLLYPPGYVRWTAGRNIECFIGELARGTVHVEQLITHRFPVERAEEAYAVLRRPAAEPPMGIVLTYPEHREVERTLTLHRPARRMPSGQICLGVIGGGLFAQTVLLPTLRRLPAISLRGIATATGVSARHVGGRLGFEFCTTDYRTVLSDEHVNAVVIATRHDLHATLVAEALRAGKHVFVEKPLGLTPEEIRLVAQAYEASSRVLAVGFNRRYSPLARIVKSFIHGARPLTLTYRVNAGAIPADHWVYDPVEGGGRWLGEGGHFVDLLQYLLDADPVRVFARKLKAEDMATESMTVMLEFLDGSLATVVYADGSDRAESRERVEVFGPGLACTLDDFRHATLVRGGRVQRIRRLEAARGYREELEAWVAAMRGDAGAPVDITTYAANAASCFAAMESMRSSAPVTVSQFDLTRDNG